MGQKHTPTGIIFFGGSTTECLYADPEVRFPAAVGGLLVNDSGGQVRTLNAGVSGSHTLHMLISLIAKGIPERPRVAVLMENINDLATLTKCGSYWNAPPSRQIIQNSNLPPDPRTKKLQRWLQSTARLFYGNISERAILAFPNLFRFLDPDRSDKEPDDEWKSTRQNSLHDQASVAAEFKSSLLSFISVCRIWNITPVLMTQFNRLKPDDDFTRRSYESKKIDYDDFCRRYSEFNEIIRKTAKEADCLLVDLDKLVDPAENYLYDSVHLNEQGCLLVAGIIASAIADAIPGFQLTVDPSPESSTTNKALTN